MTILVLTVMGDDRPGLVDALSGAIEAQGGNWERSSMAHLANKFAGVVTVNLPDDRLDALEAELRTLADQGLHVLMEPAEEHRAVPQRRLKLELLGQDHPGIVHDIAHALAQQDISIETLDTETRSASMGGGTLFHANAVLVAPEGVSLDELETRLEALANELMVDLELGVDDD